MYRTLLAASLTLALSHAFAETSPPVVVGSPVQVIEGNSGTTPMRFVLRVPENVPLTAPLTLSYRSVNGTATAPSDYAAATGQVQFTATQRERTVEVAIVGDTVAEPNESLFLELSTVAAAAPFRVIGTILNDDGAEQPPSALRVSAQPVVEGNAGTTRMDFQIFRSAITTNPTPIVFNWRTQNGSATAGSDYVAANGQVTLTGPGPYAPIPVTINGDTAVEPNETVRMVLEQVGGTLRLDGGGVILNDDGSAPPPNTNAIVPISATGTEPATGTAPVRVGVRLLRPATTEVRVNFAVGEGSATAGSDYTGPASGTLTFAPGDVLEEIPYQILADNLSEPTERVRLMFSNPIGLPLGRNSADLVILDRSSTLPSQAGIAVVACRPFVNEGDSAKLLLRRIGSSANAASVQFATANGRATTPADYIAATGTVTWAAGDAAHKIVTIATTEDTVQEQPENFFVDFSNAVGAQWFGPARAPIIIRDDDSVAIDGMEALCNEGEADAAFMLENHLNP